MTIREYIDIQRGLLWRLLHPTRGAFSHDETAEFNRRWAKLSLTGGGHNACHWRGLRMLKCPMDLWIYSEIIADTLPTLIIETGTFEGGSAVWMADMQRMLGVPPNVITVDIAPRKTEPFAGVRYLHASSASRELANVLKREAVGHRVMVVLDSDHSTQHVRAELDALAPLATPGCYLIVEDTNIDYYPVDPEFPHGPHGAVREWLPRHPEFERDLNCERFVLSYNPSGYLRRL